MNSSRLYPNNLVSEIRGLCHTGSADDVHNFILSNWGPARMANEPLETSEYETLLAAGSYLCDQIRAGALNGVNLVGERGASFYIYYSAHNTILERDSPRDSYTLNKFLEHSSEFSQAQLITRCIGANPNGLYSWRGRSIPMFKDIHSSMEGHIDHIEQLIYYPGSHNISASQLEYWNLLRSLGCLEEYTLDYIFSSELQVGEGGPCLFLSHRHSGLDHDLVFPRNDFYTNVFRHGVPGHARGVAPRCPMCHQTLSANTIMHHPAHEESEPWVCHECGGELDVRDYTHRIITDFDTIVFVDSEPSGLSEESDFTQEYLDELEADFLMENQLEADSLEPDLEDWSTHDR